MKRLVLMSIPALICGMVFWFASSCTRKEPVPDVNIFLWHQKTNIEWYNETTSEIKFGNENVTGILYFENGIVYSGGKKLFELYWSSCFMSRSVNAPSLIDCSMTSSLLENNISEKYYIGRGYPNWEYWTEEFWAETNLDKTPDWMKEREKNWKAIEPGWNEFIEQLKKEGKYRK